MKGQKMQNEPAQPAVIEVVTFLLAPGQTPDSFEQAARATGPVVAAMPGFIARHLSCGEDGQWTDHIHWQDMAAAAHAAAAIMQDPAAQPFLQAIDMESITMRHETLHWQMP
jgi:hypothetical protein